MQPAKQTTIGILALTMSRITNQETHHTIRKITVTTARLPLHLAKGPHTAIASCFINLGLILSQSAQGLTSKLYVPAWACRTSYAKRCFHHNHITGSYCANRACLFGSTGNVILLNLSWHICKISIHSMSCRPRHIGTTSIEPYLGLRTTWTSATNVRHSLCTSVFSGLLLLAGRAPTCFYPLGGSRHAYHNGCPGLEPCNKNLLLRRLEQRSGYSWNLGKSPPYKNLQAAG